MWKNEGGVLVGSQTKPSSLGGGGTVRCRLGLPDLSLLLSSTPRIYVCRHRPGKLHVKVKLAAALLILLIDLEKMRSVQAEVRKTAIGSQSLGVHPKYSKEIQGACVGKDLSKWHLHQKEIVRRPEC